MAWKEVSGPKVQFLHHGYVYPESVRKMPRDAIQRMESLRKEARRVLERDSAAELWIHQRNTLLGDVAPVALLNSDDGLSQVMALLGRIEHGLPV